MALRAQTFSLQKKPLRFKSPGPAKTPRKNPGKTHERVWLFLGLFFSGRLLTAMPGLATGYIGNLLGDMSREASRNQLILLVTRRNSTFFYAVYWLQRRGVASIRFLPWV